MISNVEFFLKRCSPAGCWAWPGDSPAFVAARLGLKALLQATSYLASAPAGFLAYAVSVGHWTLRCPQWDTTPAAENAHGLVPEEPGRLSTSLHLMLGLTARGLRYPADSETLRGPEAHPLATYFHAFVSQSMLSALKNTEEK